MRTIIGYPAPNLQNTGKAHGAALGKDEVALTKEAIGFPTDTHFYAPEEVVAHARQVVDRGRAARAEWQKSYDDWAAAHPERKALHDRLAARRLPDGWTSALPVFEADQKGVATRKASGKVLEALGGVIPELWGGSADLAESNNTTIDESSSFLPEGNPLPGADPYGRTLHFGIREHAMGAVMNGIALHGGTRVYGGTFLVFSDYMRGAVRLAALMGLPVTYVWTHDSIGLGEDGPPRVAALRPRPGRRPAGRRQRDRRRLAHHPGDDRPAGRHLPDPAERPDLRPDRLRLGGGHRARRVRPA
jgi:transketolase